MKTLEEELAFVDNDSGLLNIDTKIETEITPQVSPYDPHQSGNPMMSSQSNSAKAAAPIVLAQGAWNNKTVPLAKNPLQGTPYAREEGYRVRRRPDVAPLPDVTQHTQRQSIQAPLLVQQVVQSPLYVNLPPGSYQQLSDGRGGSLVKIESSQIHQQHNLPTSQPLLIPNNPKGVTPLILKGGDQHFSPLILQSNILAQEPQTLVYTSAPVQGEFYSTVSYSVCYNSK